MKTKIEWATDVWNPVTGCTKVSEGCRHCYAEGIANRFWGERKFTDVQCHPDRLDAPLHWKKPRRVFVNSMSDLFHKDVSFEFILRMWMTMAAAHEHTFMILTKRPDRMSRFVNEWLPGAWGLATMSLKLLNKPIPNVWLGVTVENQKAADERVPLLLQTPAAVRFVSVEPMLGPVNLTRIKWAKIPVDPKNYKFGAPPPDELWSMRNSLLSHSADAYNKELTGIDWVICGGETGPGARPMHPDWVRSLRDQCYDAGTPFFFKSWGQWAPDCLCDTPNPCKTTPRPQPGLPGCMFHCGKKRSGRLLDGHEWNEYPEAKK